MTTGSVASGSRSDSLSRSVGSSSVHTIPTEGAKYIMNSQLMNNSFPAAAVQRSFISVAAAWVLLFMSAMVAGQTPSGPPKPGPEHQKLAALVGSWTTAGEVTENPFGPAEKWSGSFTWKWTPGNFAIIRHFDGRGSVTGENRGIEIISYDNSAKTYTWYGVDNQAWTGLLKANISGNTLTTIYEQQAKGRPYKIRGTLTGIGSDHTNWVSEYSEDGKVWKEYFHATDTRVNSDATANGQKVSSQSKDDVEQMLIQMERDWADAILKKDFLKIERILAEDFIFTGFDGNTQTRDQGIEGLKSGEWSPETMTYENVKVRVFGNTAVVTLLQNEKSKTKGKDSSGQYLFMDVFLKRDGRWQIVAEQAARLEQPKP